MPREPRRAFVPILAATLALSSFAACTHATMCDSVVMKIDDHDAQVCLGKGEVSVGDRVNIVRHACLPASGGGGKAPQTCEPRVVAQGEVVQVLNDHYSLVRIARGDFVEGDTVEKAK